MRVIWCPERTESARIPPPSGRGRWPVCHFVPSHGDALQCWSAFDYVSCSGAGREDREGERPQENSRCDGTWPCDRWCKTLLLRQLRVYVCVYYFNGCSIVRNLLQVFQLLFSDIVLAYNSNDLKDAFMIDLSTAEVCSSTGRSYLLF